MKITSIEAKSYVIPVELPRFPEPEMQKVLQEALLSWGGSAALCFGLEAKGIKMPNVERDKGLWPS